ncbi:uncharacterized protein PV09_06019 [Verruconis gallopava]|uniref:Rhodopsin domain-containing protein n=1 Tax=Verruconis gallopava TaxID=253628 RepID=A0A0D2ATW8_9PEZI|nr:uncharacterized protein PV09_06019 [Verruconis gallopava]KIW02564.1 hypothetical protein PV09_06019 [Verruconis gallopava]
MRDESVIPAAVFGCGIAFLAICSILVPLRLYIRCSRNGGSFDVGDGFLVLGWLSATTHTALAVHVSLYHVDVERIGQGSSIKEQVNASFYSFIMEIFFLFGLSSVKISILAFYHSLASQVGNKNFTRLLRAILAALGAFLVVYILLPLSSCIPLDASWKRIDPNFKTPYACMDRGVLSLVASVINSVTDLTAGIIPLVLTFIFNRPLRARARLFFLLGLGLIVLAAGIIRTILLQELYDGDSKNDWTWTTSGATLAAMWELHTVIICACIPFIYRAYQLFCPIIKNLFNCMCLRASVDPFERWQSCFDGHNLAEGKKLQKMGAEGYTRQARNAKATSNLQLDKPLPALMRSLETDCEIAVAYSPPPLRRVRGFDEKCLGQEVHPHRTVCLSDLSWLSVGSKNPTDSGSRTTETDEVPHDGRDSTMLEVPLFHSNASSSFYTFDDWTLDAPRPLDVPKRA